MDVQDLGDLEGPILVFGGPYSNFQATKALLAEGRARAIDPSQMICTGDVVAYCGQPAETVALIRESGCTAVAGNCERQLAARRPDCGCGFASGTVCDVLSAGWYGFADARLDADDRAWMAGLPDWVTFRHSGRRYVVVHGGASDIAQMLWPVSPDALFAREFARVETEIGAVDGLICGHTGIQFQHQTPQGLWINAGAIGMPPNDGNPATRFAILSDGKVSFETLDYEFCQARTVMEQAGLKQGYHLALSSGYWPSEEVLPPEMRANG